MINGIPTLVNKALGNINCDELKEVKNSELNNLLKINDIDFIEKKKRTKI